jgi:hypothetical protein
MLSSILKISGFSLAKAENPEARNSQADFQRHHTNDTGPRVAPSAVLDDRSLLAQAIVQTPAE